MARTIYDKPTRALLKDMLISLELQPGQVFTTARAIQWFAQHYPKLKAGSIRAHLVQASTNDRSRLHHMATRESDDLLFKVGSGQFRLYEAGKDPAPIRELMRATSNAKSNWATKSKTKVPASSRSPVRPSSRSRRTCSSTWPTTWPSSNPA